LNDPHDDRRPALRAADGGPRPFHLALPVHDLGEAEGFYAGLLGAEVGRRSERWIDFDLGGHQITVHLLPGGGPPPPRSLRESGCDFLIPPRVRFRGQAGEQGTLFLQDPSGNALEFKGFRDARGLFDEAGAY